MITVEEKKVYIPGESRLVFVDVANLDWPDSLEKMIKCINNRAKQYAEELVELVKKFVDGKFIDNHNGAYVINTRSNGELDITATIAGSKVRISIARGCRNWLTVAAVRI